MAAAGFSPWNAFHDSRSARRSWLILPCDREKRPATSRRGTPGGKSARKAGPPRRAGAAVLDDDLLPAATKLLEAVQPLDGEPLLALGIFGEDLADPQTIPPAAALPQAGA